jgi:hypothetical protein
MYTNKILKKDESLYSLCTNQKLLIEEGIYHFKKVGEPGRAPYPYDNGSPFSYRYGRLRGFRE